MPQGLQIQKAIPVLQVADVARSIEWYRTRLGFVAAPFPDVPPFQFAILVRGSAEIMLRAGQTDRSVPSAARQWDIYLRLGGGQLRELHAAFHAARQVTRRLERMFYGLAEFEITDPDGHVICLSEELPDMQDLPAPPIESR